MLQLSLVFFALAPWTLAEPPPLDLEKKHPLRVLAADAPEAANIPRREGTLLLANFNHKGDTFLAEVPVDALESSYLVVSDFIRHKLFRVAHASVFFATPEGRPVRLFAAGSAEVMEDLPGFMYSLYFAAEKGVEYNPKEGLKEGRYASTHTLKSPHELIAYARINDTYLKAAARKAGKDTKSVTPSTVLYEIAFDAEQNGRFARSLIEKGHAEGTSGAYHTACRNCNHPIFHAIDNVRPVNVLRCVPVLVTEALKASPARSPVSLRARGLLKRKLRFNDHPLFAKPKRE